MLHHLRPLAAAGEFRGISVVDRRAVRPMVAVSAGLVDLTSISLCFWKKEWIK
jgi:hypothetical protein